MRSVFIFFEKINIHRTPPSCNIGKKFISPTSQNIFKITFAERDTKKYEKKVSSSVDEKILRARKIMEIFLSVYVFRRNAFHT